MDEGADSRVKYTSFNWVGVAYKLFRVSLDKCKNRPDLKYSGVYFLFGNSNETVKPVVYIGQADVRKNGEGILNRLLEHRRNPNKDYWSEAVVFITSNNSLGPTEISYLEHELCRLAKEINRYEVKNGNDPSPGNLIEEKKSELNTFIENVKLVMSLAGHPLFIPLDEPQSESDSDLCLLQCIHFNNMKDCTFTSRIYFISFSKQSLKFQVPIRINSLIQSLHFFQYHR